MQPDDPQAYPHRGVEHLNKDDFNKAIADFDRAIELNLKAVQIIRDRGWAQFSLARIIHQPQDTRSEQQESG